MVEWASTAPLLHTLVVSMTIDKSLSGELYLSLRKLMATPKLARHTDFKSIGEGAVGLMHQLQQLLCLVMRCRVLLCQCQGWSCKLQAKCAQTLTKLAARAEQRRTRTSENCHLNSNGNIYYLYLLLQCKVRKADIKLISLHPNN